MTIDAVMPISGPFIADGSNREWTFSDWIAFEASHIRLVIQDSAGNLVSTVVSGIVVPDEALNNPDGGTVTYPAVGQPALPAGRRVYVTREVPFDQPTALGNQGPYYPDTHERVFDYTEMQIQQLNERLQRTIALPIGSGVFPELPAPSANKLFGWNEGVPWKIENKDIIPSTGLVTGAAGLDLLAMTTKRAQQSYLGIAHLFNSLLVDLPLVIGWTGQSNMLGSAFNGGDRSTKNDYVFIFESVPSNPGQTVGWKNAGPDSPDWPLLPTGNHIAWHVGDILQRMTGRTALLVGAAAGGQPVCEWLPGGGGGISADGVTPATGIMWGTLTATHALALDTPIPTTGLTMRQMGRVRFDVLLWHQGEADADYRVEGSKNTWKARFKRFYEVAIDPSLGGSSAEPLLWFGAQVLIGELLWGGVSGPNPTDDRNDAIGELDAKYPYFKSVSSRNLPSVDQLHFTGSGLVEFAWRYVRRYFDGNRQDYTVWPLTSNLDTISEGGTYRHIIGATGAPDAGLPGFVTQDNYAVNGNKSFANQYWQPVTQNASHTFKRFVRSADANGIWGAWRDVSNFQFTSAANMRIAGPVKLFKGTMTVNAASTVTVNLPETMADATYIPDITVAIFGGASPVPQLIVAGKTTTSFTVQNIHAANGVTFGWKVMDRVA